MSDIRLAVIQALDDEWRDSHVIHSRVDCWSRITIRRVLSQLAAEGVIERQGTYIASGVKYVFRRKQPEPTMMPVTEAHRLDEEAAP